MSRFDRRLKGNSGGGSSPRPGVSTCKIRNNKTQMLSGFISVVEKNNNVSSKEKNHLIKEISSKSYVSKGEDKVNNTIKINETLKIAISQTTDSKLKQLLIHELRINTLEMNLDCLTDLKCEEINKKQEENEEELSLEEMKKSVLELKKSMIEMEEMKMNFKSEISKLKMSIQENDEKNKNTFMELQKITQDIQDLKESRENDTNRNIFEEVTNEKLEKYERTINSIIENLRENNPEMDLIY